MRIIASLPEIQKVAESLRQQEKTIAVVPTMGFLHEGHASLIRIAREKADAVITTIFVNPTQFAPTEDFNRYPRDMERDIHTASGAGTDILFTPTAEAMYPAGYHTSVLVEELSARLEGVFRPTHFRGVTTVVAKLFHLTKPHFAVFGQKDAQQAVIIKKMVSDLNFDIEIIVGPTLREKDGLAMSSRNVYLTESERRQSTALFRSLELATSIIHNGERDVERVLAEMRELILAEPAAKIDYVSISDPETLEECSRIRSGREVLVSLAVRIGTTRLIDNCTIVVS